MNCGDKEGQSSSMSEAAAEVPATCLQPASQPARGAWHRQPCGIPADIQLPHSAAMPQLVTRRPLAQTASPGLPGGSTARTHPAKPAAGEGAFESLMTQQPSGGQQLHAAGQQQWR